MRISRFFAEAPLEVGDEVSLGERRAHYLSRVLRLREGAEIVLFNGDGTDYRCRLVGVERDSATVAVLERCPGVAESPLRITLSQAMSRGERMDHCLQKATELGVACVQLLLSERVELRLSGSRLEKRMAHWRGVMQAASEQCGRATVPELGAPIELGAWAASPQTRLVLDADAGLSLREVDIRDSIDIAVGPEGGFSRSELGALDRAGVRAVRLGPRVLRTETAGPAAIAVIQSMAGDLL